MRIHKSGNYDGIDWLKALSARKPTQTELTEEETVANASQLTAEAAFKVPAPRESPEEAVRTASLEIQRQARSSQAMAACAVIRQKLADRLIDPVALGVADKVQWESSIDADWVEAVAKKAAVAFQKKQSMEWQEKAMTQKPVSVRPNVETSLSGRVMPSSGAGEETRGQQSRVPVNANSILDPDRLARLFTQPPRPEEEPLEHDRMVARERGERKSREDEKKAARAEAAKVAQDNPDPMRTGQVIRSGGQDADVFVQKVPKNQISMVDTIGTPSMTREEMASKLQGYFMGRLDDNGQEIREANEARRKEIQGERQKDGSRPKDRSWDKVENLKPQTTGDLQEKLMQLWAPK